MTALEYMCDTPMEDETSCPDKSIGIFRLMVLCREPLRTLRILSDAIKFSLTGKGGAALSAIEDLRHHGDKRYSQIMHQIVEQVSRKGWMVIM